MSPSIRRAVDFRHPPGARLAGAHRPAPLAQWLMPNDFEPRVGHRFRFRTDPAPGFDGIVDCEVLVLEPERRLEIGWRGGGIDARVSWVLEPASGRRRWAGAEPESTDHRGEAPRESV